MYRSILLGAIVAFAWSWVSWTVIPWHECGFKAFKDEQAVARVIKENAPEDGLYTIPSMCFSDKSLSQVERDRAENTWKHGPIMMSAIRPHGASMTMGKELGIHFVTCLIGASLITFLLCWLGRALGYWKKVWLVTLTVLVGTFLSTVPLWNWHGFSPGFVIIGIIDMVAAWFLAALVMAPFIKPKS